MDEEKTKKKPRNKKLWLLIVLVVFLGIIGTMLGMGIIPLPKCYTSTQERIDWPPTEPGIYEESSSNKLRVLSPAAFSAPNMLTMCNVSGEPAAQTVAYVPLDAKFVMLAPGQEDWEYGIYHSVDVPNTGECVRVPAANEVEGVTVRPDEENPQMVWILPPAPLEQGSTYMVYVKGAETQGVIVTAGPAPQ